MRTLRFQNAGLLALATCNYVASTFAQLARDILDFQGAAKKVALKLVATMSFEKRQLSIVFNPFGYDF